MSTQITTAFVEQYSSNVSMLAQQMGSRLRGAVDVETIRGKHAFFDQIGVTAAQVRSTRHGATPQINTPHSRRRVGLADYEWADLIDDLDKVRMLVDPTSSYAKAAAAAMNRAMDDGVESVFLMAEAQHQAVASRLVKEIGRLNGNVSKFVTPAVNSALQKKLK